MKVLSLVSSNLIRIQSSSQKYLKIHVIPSKKPIYSLLHHCAWLSTVPPSVPVDVKSQATLSPAIDARKISTPNLIVPKKKRLYKKKSVDQAHHSDEVYEVQAYSTARGYDLSALREVFLKSKLFTQTSNTDKKTVSDVTDPEKILHLTCIQPQESEPQEMYLFEDGAVVFWNFSHKNQKSILNLIQKYEQQSFDSVLVETESEDMAYTYSDGPTKVKQLKNMVVFNQTTKSDMEKYTISNALAMSVRLGMLESLLESYIDRTEPIVDELSQTGKVGLNHKQVLINLGELLILRHHINLRSDLLDTPDFYWEHETLENLYNRATNHFSITKRTAVINEKLNHCISLMELLKEQLSTKHSHRLEWIIIYLILVEVIFEVVHLVK